MSFKKGITAVEAYQRDPKYYDSFITLEEMKEWQPVIKLDTWSREYYEKKLLANRELTKAIWKYSRCVHYDSFDHGMYEWFVNALRVEWESLQKIIAGIEKEKIKKV